MCPYLHSIEVKTAQARGMKRIILMRTEFISALVLQQFVRSGLRKAFWVLIAVFAACPRATARVAVFWQQGFPTVSSDPVSREVLERAFDGMAPEFLDIRTLKAPAALQECSLLVMPYGSALPVEDWPAIVNYLRAGGNLLVLGGQPFRVPVAEANGTLRLGKPQDTYSRQIGIWHTYAIPQADAAHFRWKPGYSFLPKVEVRAQKFFVLEGRLDGLGYMLSAAGERVAAPVVVMDRNFLGPASGGAPGSRLVMLDFEPQRNYWELPEGIALIRAAADYARHGATQFWLETQYASLRPREPEQIVVHLRRAPGAAHALSLGGSVRLELISSNRLLQAKEISCEGIAADQEVEFHLPLAPGFYTLRATFSAEGRPREFSQNGFWVDDGSGLKSGPVLGVRGNFLTKDGSPYFPFGTNYFTTEENGWDFSGPRNAWVWERDFGEMQKHGVTLVRTGVWMGQLKFIDPATGGVSERFLRNVDAYLLSARGHGIFVNFTLCAFDPQTVWRQPGERSAIRGAGSNPYTDPVAIRAEQNYMLSIVRHFRSVPFLSWDLINEPSFSNPQHLWKGNTPNGDPTELAAWRQWLQKKYRTVAQLAAAWSVPAEQLGSFQSISLPSEQDLQWKRYGNQQEVRAFDYNLFAQDMFSRWVKLMVAAIRATGSKQLIDVGQDEGGVTDRLLNPFYGASGVSFTTNHTYWQDDALLWDSVAAKLPGIPNIVGETGYQPVWQPDGKWRYDEISGFPLIERKLALGFAAGSSGALQWDWAREPNFGMLRGDGSSKIWEDMMTRMGAFARQAAPYAARLIQPEVAIVLPQSLQLSVFNPLALGAQQNCVRALYQVARSAGYAVGEYQTGKLGRPKLIILPSPWVLSQTAWEAILDRVRRGSVLLVSGRFDQDPHFHATGRQHETGIDYQPSLLTLRDDILEWPSGKARLIFAGNKTTFLDRASLPGGRTFEEKALGQGKILFVPFPLELNSNLQAIGDVYAYALKVAGVQHVYLTNLRDPGILICPTRFPGATLYVLTSETGSTQVSFEDLTSGRTFSGKLAAGRAALLLISGKGKVLASYNWQ
jgi:hypothetical protein